MCGISGSFDRGRFITLMQGNQYRGSFSYSIMVLDNQFKVVHLSREFGEFNEHRVPKVVAGHYWIGHVQAPTGGLIRDIERVHPSEYRGSYLFHNGILKRGFLTSVGGQGRWDTGVLHELLRDDGPDALDYVDGSFSCVYVTEGNVFMFRNATSPMFMNDQGDISSVKQVGVHTPTDHNRMYRLGTQFTTYTVFNNKNQPYYFHNGKG